MLPLRELQRRTASNITGCEPIGAEATRQYTPVLVQRTAPYCADYLAESLVLLYFFDYLLKFTVWNMTHARAVERLFPSFHHHHHRLIFVLRFATTIPTTSLVFVFRFTRQNIFLDLASRLVVAVVVCDSTETMGGVGSQ